jgi:hypothetical protein
MLGDSQKFKDITNVKFDVSTIDDLNTSKMEDYGVIFVDEAD